jgi:rSAM/selenodomain-associated transferase 1
MNPMSAVRLIVFARVPKLGGVKTRLAATVGPKAALAAHRLLLGRTLGTGARAGGFSDRVLHIAGDDDQGECAALARAWGYRLLPQSGRDLGERMANAIDAAAGEGASAIVIGSDCAVLSVNDLDEARQALASHDVVLVPAEDGGYALVGCARPWMPIFEGVEWGTSRVLTQTLDRARDAGLSVARLRTLWDIDTEEDWNRWLLGRDGPL